MSHRVVVTGVGAITPLGPDAASTWRRLLAGATAATAWPDLAAEGFPCAVACRVTDPPPGDPRRRGRDLALLAAREALRSAGLGALPADAAIHVGTTMGESGAFEAAVDDPDAGFDLDQAGGHVFAAHLAAELGVTGPQRTHGTACAAGNYAIGAAARAVAAGRVPAALAGGVEPFSRLALLGFARMRAMTPDRCRPFAAGRRGMQLGEAAAFLVLERADRAVARGARPLAVVAGLGLSADAHHPTAPRPDGHGMAAAMRAALDAARLTPGEIGWVSAHGTGTPRSDAAEALALRSVFGDGTVPPVTGIKGAVGHSLGAATAVEAVAAVLALDTGTLPPTANVAEADPALGLDLVLTARPAAGLATVLSAGYAFGGLNSALILVAP